MDNAHQPPPDAAAIAACWTRVLTTEADALTTMATVMPADFTAVIGAVLASTGRVVVAGVGKSGHIGRKIAATLASTGTAAQFVHATEASHGDMGMISTRDICLLISNSGETTELRDIIAHTRRFSIPLVGISSAPDSTLMRAADFRLLLPVAPEACAIGMAPTTSTTLTLALGDALAVALMEQRHFLPDDFRVFHPGGKLGQQMLTVAQLMHGAGELPLVRRDTGMGDTLIEMTSKGFGIAGVVDDGQLIGVVSDGDLRRNMARLMDHTAGEIATPDPLTISPEALAVRGMAIMNDRKVNVLMVVDADNRPLGVLHIHDCLRAGLV